MASLNDHETRIVNVENSLMQTFSFEKTLSVVAGQWNSTDIKLPSTGTYVVKFRVNTYNYGGRHYDEHYSGILSFFSTGTNNDVIVEIPLTNAGHAPNGHFYTLGFKHVFGNTGQQEIVISSTENTTNCPYTFVFRRVL